MLIDCYRNLNAAKRNMALFIWSLRCGENSKSLRVRGHHEHLYLEGVSLRVQQGGLDAVRKVGQRNVYAYLRAAEYYLLSDLAYPLEHPTLDSLTADGYRPLTCNPYKEGHFVWADDRSPAPLTLTAVWLTPFGAFGLE